MSTPVRQVTMLSHARRYVQWVAQRFAFSALLLATVTTSPARALATNDDQQRMWRPVASSEAFAGEITYEFDSVLNQTTATYVAPLRNGGLLHRILFLTPTVHTIKASYQFDGRIRSRVPDSVRLMFVSDEYVSAPGSETPFGPPPDISIRFGQAVATSLVRVSQRIEVDSNSPALAHRIDYSAGKQAMQMMELPSTKGAHITRRATALLSICEFLSLLDREVVDGTVAGVAFTLNHKVVTGLKVFAAEMLPDPSQQRPIDCTSK